MHPRYKITREKTPGGVLWVLRLDGRIVDQSHFQSVLRMRAMVNPPKSGRPKNKKPKQTRYIHKNNEAK